jgi:hypothetical protein
MAMSDPISNDARLHAAMQTIEPVPGKPLEDPASPVDLEGLLYLPTRAAQNADLVKELRRLPLDLAQARAKEFLLELALPIGEDAIGMGAAAIETFICAAKTIAEGDQLNAAIKREYGVGACLEFCSSALPEGFVAAVEAQFVKPGSVSPGAKAVEAKLFEAPDFPALQTAMIANCRDGQQYAFSHDLKSAEALGFATKHDPAFAERYQHDIAFKLGADSVVWAFLHDQAALMAHELPPTAEPSTVELRG